MLYDMYMYTYTHTHTHTHTHTSTITATPTDKDTQNGWWGELRQSAEAYTGHCKLHRQTSAGECLQMKRLILSGTERSVAHSVLQHYCTFSELTRASRK